MITTKDVIYISILCLVPLGAVIIVEVILIIDALHKDKKEDQKEDQKKEKEHHERYWH